MDLDYKITTTAELSGAEAAAAALERQIGKAKALKQDYSALSDQLKTMRASINDAKDSLDKATPALEKEGEAAKEAGRHMNSARMRGELFRRVMLSIGAYTPGLEYAVMGGATAFGALTAGVIGGGIALESLIGWLKSFDTALANVTSGEMQAHQTAIGQIMTAWDNTTASHAKYLTELASAGKGKDATDAQIQRIKEIEAAQLESDKK